jgi:hypothetical protein
MGQRTQTSQAAPSTAERLGYNPDAGVALVGYCELRELMRNGAA